ncbi:Transcription factor fungi [Macrophomina phaseolina MS6]|uniref:Transcription factor fungi n=1 Tax=Macrophomina phaseolina (strain MS6) TaxID=1126212 RepID=K2QYE3_MACPH|nr:Transcription factor fungi [Macrophomina phaseolina MS6]
MTDEQRRLTFLRENVEHLEREKSELESLLLTLQRASESDVAEVMRVLRTGDDLYTIARHAHAGRLLSKVRAASPSQNSGSSGYTIAPQTLRSPPQVEQYQSLIRIIASAQPLELDEIVRRLRNGDNPASILASASSNTLIQAFSRDHESTPGMEAEFSGRDQFGLVKGAQDARPLLETLSQPVNNWTAVTQDQEWIGHLLSLYFSWQHQFFQNFPEALFRADMASGRTDYCSKLLVNALCAAGCLFSNSRRARRDQNDPLTAGLDFYEEAIRLLNEDRTSTLTTTAALSILCHVESSFSRLSSQWQYSGRSSRMALDLNIHLRSNKTPEYEQGVEGLATNARTHIFWGCFITDQVTSFTLGRLPLIPTNAITVEIPPVDPVKDEDEWIAHGQLNQPRKCTGTTTFRQLISLSKIVNSTLQMFFAPSKTISGSLLLEEYNKYIQWFAKLPAAVASVENAPPHVISLHMYYHAAVLLLFRPFLKARFTKSDVSPLEVCRQSANNISNLFARHREQYGLDGIFTFQLHCLLTASTIHIIKLPSISATSHLAAACNNFQDLVRQNKWATGSLDILRSLVTKWKIVLPLEVEAALYRGQEAPPTIADTAPNATIDTSIPAVKEHNHNNSGFAPGDGASAPTSILFSSSRPEKRDSRFTSPPAGVQTLPKRQRLTVPHLSNPNSTESVSKGATGQQAITSAQHQQDIITRYLFAPYPNQPAPLLGPIHTSTSHNGGDGDQGEGDAWAEELRKVSLGFDGLNFAADDGFDPFMGYRGD